MLKQVQSMKLCTNEGMEICYACSISKLPMKKDSLHCILIYVYEFSV